MAQRLRNKAGWIAKIAGETSDVKIMREAADELDRLTGGKKFTVVNVPKLRQALKDARGPGRSRTDFERGIRRGLDEATGIVNRLIAGYEYLGNELWSKAPRSEPEEEI
jgi:hypothetical protein